MANTSPKPTHEISHILSVNGQNFLILKPLKEGADEVVVSIDEILADHLIGAQDVEVKGAN